MAAMHAGRTKWLVGMREAVRLGLIPKIPGGRYKGGRRGEALRWVEHLKAERARPDAIAPADEDSAPAQFDRIVGRSLEILGGLLSTELKFTEDNRALIALQQASAEDILRLDMRINANRLRPRRVGALARLLTRVQAGDSEC